MAVIAACIGLVGGLVGAAFHMSVNAVTTLRGAHPWLLYLMPPAGLLVVWVYRVTQMEGKGTNDIIHSIHFGERVPLMLTPVIFLATVLTHVVGGSAGREGAALQIGGSIGCPGGAAVPAGRPQCPCSYYVRHERSICCTVWYTADRGGIRP